MTFDPTQHQDDDLLERVMERAAIWLVPAAIGLAVLSLSIAGIGVTVFIRVLTNP